MSTEQTNFNQPLPPPPAVAPTPAAAVQPGVSAPRPPQLKSTGAAVVLSFFPGIGHLYLGLYQRAIGFFAAFAVTILLAEKANLGILVPFVWFFCLIDAYRQTLLINAGQGPEDLWATPRRRASRARTGLGFGIFFTALGLVLLYDNFYGIDWSFLADWYPLGFVGVGIYFLVRYFVDKQKAASGEDDVAASSQ